jgi:PTH1 family peptidyl-tRNA hydrolase
LAKIAGVSWQTAKKFKAQISQWNQGQEKIILIKPLTFMNNSGESVALILSYYKILPKTLGIFVKKNFDLTNVLTVIHDDLDIEIGKFKLSTDKSAGGHKGVQSIIDHLKTKKFRRLRLGIKPLDFSLAGKPKDKYVLAQLSSKEKQALENIFASNEFKKALNT